MTSQTASRSPASLLTCPTVNVSGAGTQASRPKATPTSAPDDTSLTNTDCRLPLIPERNPRPGSASCVTRGKLRIAEFATSFPFSLPPGRFTGHPCPARRAEIGITSASTSFGAPGGFPFLT
jgi:hypothetical protein